ncbi:MAG: DUF3105 domain-containing protein [Candidatus Nanohaloarchaea archaeon]
MNREDYRKVAAIGLAVAGIGLTAVVLGGGNGDRTTPANSSLGHHVEVMGRTHISVGEKHDSYNSNPPTSGPHYMRPATRGFYSREIPEERLVHNLEHGQVWISYRNISSETRAELKDLAQKYSGALIVTKRPENDARIAVASWGRLMKLEKYNETRIENYIRSFVNNSPEPFATLPS